MKHCWDNLKLWFLLSVVPTAIVLDLLWAFVRRRPRLPFVVAAGHAYWRLAHRFHIVRG